MEASILHGQHLAKKIEQENVEKTRVQIDGISIKRARQVPSTSINDAAVTSTTSLPGEHSQGIQSIQTSRSVATCQQRSDQRGQRNGTESIEEQHSRQASDASNASTT